MRQKIINIILFGLSLIAIALYFVQVIPSVEITNDTYIGILATFIGIAVTLVLGYQIYNAIEIRQDVKNAKKEYEELKKEIQDLNKQYIEASEGISILHSTVTYHSGSHSGTAFTAFRIMHEALLSSIESDRTNYRYIYYSLRTFITDLTYQAFYQSFIQGTNKNGEYIAKVADSSSNNGRLCSDVIDEFCQPIQDTDKKLKDAPNYIKIKYEYERIMKHFWERIDEIKNGSSDYMSPEKADAILNE